MERSLYIVLCGLVLVGNWCVHGATFIRDASNTDMNNIIDETVFSDRPGFMGRITQHGFDFAANLGTRILMKELSTLTIPDQYASIASTDVTVSDIKVVDFPRPVSRLYPIPSPGYGLRWIASGINPTITADYKAEMDFAIWTITKRGTATFVGENMYFALDFFVGTDENGRPTPEVLSCKSSGEIDLDFEGQWSDIMNVGSTLFSEKIRSLVTAQICFQAKAEINSKLASQLADLPLHHTIASHYLLDLSMLRAPTFADDAVDIPLKGIVYDKEEPQEPPFHPPVIPDHDDDDDRMVYLYVTDYLINSAFLSVFNRGVIAYNVTPDMVPEEFRSYLNTSCNNDVCLGTIFPQLATLYPSDVVSIELYATSPPRASVDGNTFNVTASGEADVFVTDADDVKHSLFVINVDISGGFSLEVADQKLYINVSHMDPSAGVKESSIGDIGTGFFFESILRVAVQKVLIPRISENGAKGLDIPNVKGLEFLRTIIVDSDIKNVFVVATDVGYEVKKKKRTMTKRRQAFLARKRLERQRARGH